MNNKVKAFVMILKDLARPIMHPDIYKEYRKLKKSRHSFYLSFLKKDDLVFDVGANFGNRVEIFLGSKAKVIAFEPQEICQEYLKLKFGSKITIRTEALGEKEELLPIYINEKDPTISSLSKEFIDKVKHNRFKQSEWKLSEHVSVVTLDAMIMLYETPQFIKIDVEGFELNVLKGLSKSVPIISVEYTIPELHDELINIIDYVNSLNPNYYYNFSIGESNTFSGEKWYGYSEFKNLVISSPELLCGFGDIYISENKLS